MMHVKRWVMSTFACLAAGAALVPQSIAAAPTGAHGPAGAGFPSGFPAAPVRVVEPESLPPQRLRGEASQPEAVERIAPLASSASSPAFASRSLPVFWFSHSTLGGFMGFGCLNGANWPLSPFAFGSGSSLYQNPLAFGPCARPAFPGDDSGPPTSLVPGENKDALYGPAYSPNLNIIQ